MSHGFFPLLSDIAIRSTIILVAALVGARLCARRSAALRHAVYTAATVGVIALPAISVALPDLRAPFLAGTVSSTIEWLWRPIRSPHGEPVERSVRPTETPDFTGAIVDASDATHTGSRGGMMLIIVWGTGVMIVGWRSAVRLRRAARLMSCARPVRDEAGLAVAVEISKQQDIGEIPPILESDEVSAPATSGILRSAVLLPASRSWSHQHLQAVLLHEFAHVRRRDCLTQHLAQVSCALHWFNPLVWVVERRMALERERACDDVVTSKGTPAEGYALFLLDVARRTCECALPRAAVLAMARPSELETRLISILDASRDHSPVTRGGRRVLAAVAAVTVATAGAVHLEAEPVTPNVSEQQTLGIMGQGRDEPDTRGDSLARPQSERITRANPDVARQHGHAALGGPDSVLARVLVAALERVPRDQEDLVRERAAWALSQARGDRLIEPLITALDDEDWRVRAYAAWSLAPSGDPRAVPALVRQMSHSVWRLRAMAAHALAETADPRARAAMTSALADEAWQVRSEAVRYLSKFADFDARAHVREAQRDRHAMVRGVAERLAVP